MSLHFILDGYNIIKKIPEFFPKKLKSAREDFIRLIEEKRLTGSKKNKVTIVFDGNSDDSTFKKESPFQIIFTKDADQKIRDMVKKANNPKSIVIVTDDRELKDSVRILGVKIIDTESILEKLRRPKIKILDAKSELPSKLKDEITEELKRIWLK